MQTAGPNSDPGLLKRVLVEREEVLPAEARTLEIRVRLASGIRLRPKKESETPGRLRSAALSGVDRRLLRFQASRLD